jgi:TRAP-type mannitol/chloroaromatic compound transport system permease small subunit
MNAMKKLFAVTAGSIILVPSVYAALPVAATTAITDLQADAGALIEALWPMIAFITIGFVMFKLFKRGTNKA